MLYAVFVSIHGGPAHGSTFNQENYWYCWLSPLLHYWYFDFCISLWCHLLLKCQLCLLWAKLCSYWHLHTYRIMISFSNLRLYRSYCNRGRLLKFKMNDLYIYIYIYMFQYMIPAYHLDRALWTKTRNQRLACEFKPDLAFGKPEFKRWLSIFKYQCTKKLAFQ